MNRHKTALGRNVAVAAALLLPTVHRVYAAEPDGPVKAVSPAEAALVPLEWMPDGRPNFTHRLAVSGRVVRFDGAMAEAKGPLAFLADEAALRAGKIALTNEQAAAALAELIRVTGQDVKATLEVSLALGNPANMRNARDLRFPINWKKDTTAAGGWIASDIETRSDGIGIKVDSQLVTDGRIQLTVTVEVSEFDGFVEHAGPTATSTALPEFFASINAKPGVTPPPVNLGPHAEPFFEPVFSTHTMTATFRMKSGETVVLRGEGRRGASVEGGATSKSETLLVFLTADVEPLVKHVSPTTGSPR